MRVRNRLAKIGTNCEDSLEERRAAERVQDRQTRLEAQGTHATGTGSTQKVEQAQESSARDAARGGGKGRSARHCLQPVPPSVWKMRTEEKTAPSRQETPNC